ncbi:hypothetical protein DPMN_072379 [Dreissena polymorpha]|uniref:Uncharacterized protein n=1 Tax=Dreissena polymorpha TaxID=45954 RepID=A0A9D3Z6C3_DREPO|nr:hypothetical protein DPMN_072379 [Dreissena polymorpha]
MLAGPVEEKPHSKKKGYKKKDDDSVDSPRPLGMPPSYPISDFLMTASSMTMMLIQMA